LTLLFKTLFFCVIAAFFVSTYGNDLVDAVGTVKPNSKPSKSNKKTNIVNSLQIPIQRNGQYWLDMTVNGRSINFLVDTGASFVALSHNDAVKLGLNIRESDYSLKVNTAAGITTMAPVTLDVMTVDFIELYNVKAFVAREGMLSVSLLGMNYLNRLTSFEFRDQELVFEQ